MEKYLRMKIEKINGETYFSYVGEARTSQNRDNEIEIQIDSDLWENHRESIRQMEMPFRCRTFKVEHQFNSIFKVLNF